MNGSQRLGKKKEGKISIKKKKKIQTLFDRHCRRPIFNKCLQNCNLQDLQSSNLVHSFKGDPRDIKIDSRYVYLSILDRTLGLPYNEGCHQVAFIDLVAKLAQISRWHLLLRSTHCESYEKVMILISSAMFTESLLLPSPIKSFFNQRSARFVSFVAPHRRLGWKVKEMSNCLKIGNVGYETKAGNVLPVSEDHIEEAIDVVKAEKVIAVPTDTLYGFACDACSAQAVNQIYEIKGRKQTSPLAICVADVADIARFASVNHLPHGLLDSLLPGPVTVVLKRGDSSILEKSLNLGLESIGVRVPEYDFIRAIARGSGTALALTSANLSGQPSSVSIGDFEDLWKCCAYVYDGGVLPCGRAGSTVVDLTKPRTYKILRPGSARQQTIAILQRFSLEETP